MSNLLFRAKTLLLQWLSWTLVVFPSFIKIPIYRKVYGYRIGKKVKIGLVWISNVKTLAIGDYVIIRHFTRIKDIPEMRLGDFTTIGMGNTFTSALEFTHPASIEQRGNHPRLIVGKHCGIAMGHYFDIQDEFVIGAYTTIAGVNSVFFTHYIDVERGLQSACPIRIGEYCMLGSSVRFSPGAGVANCSVVGMGAVVTKSFEDEYSFIAGNPATVIKKLPEDAVYFHRKQGRILSFAFHR